MQTAKMVDILDANFEDNEINCPVCESNEVLEENRGNFSCDQCGSGWHVVSSER